MVRRKNKSEQIVPGHDRVRVLAQASFYSLVFFRKYLLQTAANKFHRIRTTSQHFCRKEFLELAYVELLNEFAMLEREKQK